MEKITSNDVIKLWRPLSQEEIDRVENLIPIIIDNLKLKAQRVGKDLDKMSKSPTFFNVLKSVVIDVVSRTLMTSTNQEPMTQTSESALGYSWSGTFLVPGGGLFIKDSELAKLGLKTQRYGVIDFYDTNKGNPCDFDIEE
ncbi:MAG: phage Gp19/Gp15/Gp42 family protein [Anaerococcus hydrogenalis]|uniref:phage Gp19/Gp15/Gp42 family protein n=1 Tax=Anaerococcus hydrogenalis TaxID=33029 RepID=UPI00290722D0|nr:phage Gp19/Gp15/Gp42 family protein [Anaerococcus hydrogenalis]MDU3687551.1 phage Gp19/Gp15/Gp42 family protein [Anaerococcus hydrogenalis]